MGINLYSNTLILDPVTFALPANHLAIKMAGLLCEFMNKHKQITINDCRCSFDEDRDKLIVFLPFSIDKKAFLNFLYKRAHSPITELDQQCWDDSHFVIIPHIRNDISAVTIFEQIGYLLPKYNFCLIKKRYHYELKFDRPIVKDAEFILLNILKPTIK